MRQHRYIIRKIRIADGYLTRTEIIDEVELMMDPEDGIYMIVSDSDLPASFRKIAPGEQLVIHNAGVD